MAQVSLYLDKEMYRKVETAAQICGESISKYVATVIQDHFDHEWPPDYANLFGSVTDDTFFPNGAEKVLKESSREPL